jgi:hypothetical protein
MKRIQRSPKMLPALKKHYRIKTVRRWTHDKYGSIYSYVLVGRGKEICTLAVDSVDEVRRELNRLKGIIDE